ncbi:hypothetical protein HDU79_003131, partial [Rhizoclosmatium sp. JEL0117]
MITTATPNSLLWRCKGHGATEHEAFLSYRVATEAELANTLANLVESVGRRRYNVNVRVFLDKNCLNNAEDWQQGFLSGLASTKLIVYLISQASLETLFQKTLANEVDNVLLEIEQGLKKAAKREAKLFPVLIGSTDENGHYTNFKFPKTYPDVLHTGSNENVCNTMNQLFKNQAAFVTQSPSNENALYLVADSILRLIIPYRVNLASNHGIPPLAKNFMGRSSEIESIKQSLFIQGVSLVSGVPGMGKSSVAAKVAHDSLKLYQHVFWISLESEASANSGFESIFNALGLFFAKPTTEAYCQEVSKWLASHQGYLLVIDNADDHSLVQYMFKDVIQFVGDVLITSRNNNIMQYFPHLELSSKQIVEMEKWDVATVCNYLRSRTERETNPSDPSVSVIIQLLDGHSLSIAQACSYIVNKRIPYAEFVNRMHTVVLDPSNYPETGNRGSIAKIFLLFKASLGTNTTPLKLLEAISFISPVSIPMVLVEALHTQIQIGSEYFDDLNILVNNGWLRENKNTFFTHTIIQELSRPIAPSFSEIHTYISVLVSLYPENFYNLDSKNLELCKQLSIQAQTFLKNLVNVHYVSNADVWLEIKVLLNTWFQFLGQTGQISDAKTMYNTCLQLETQFYPESELLVNTKFQLGIIERAFSNLVNIQFNANFSNAKELYIETLELQEKLYGNRQHSSVAATIHELATVAFNQGDFVTAKKLYVECLQTKEEVYKTRHHPSVAATILALGQIASNEGDYVTAKNLYIETLDIQEKVYGTKQHPSVAGTIFALGQIASNEGDYAEGKKMYLDCLQIEEKVYGTRQHHSVASTIFALGQISLVQGDFATAKNLYLETLDIQEKVFGTRQHPSVASTIYALGQTASNQGDYVEAKKLYVETLEIQTKVYGTRKHPLVAATIHELATVAFNQGDFVTAKKLYVECLQTKEEVYKTRHHPSVAATILALGQIASNEGDYVTAKNLYIETLDIQEK